MSVEAGDISIATESPLGEDLALIFQRHTADMHAETPPDSIHMMPRDALVSPAIGFFVLRLEGRPVAMGALKRWGGDRGELKSMHVLTELRGHGLARIMLEHLLDHARAEGLSALWLETGTQPGFAAARQLYTRAGFVECPPFGDYHPDPNSVFMTLQLDPDR